MKPSKIATISATLVGATLGVTGVAIAASNSGPGGSGASTTSQVSAPASQAPDTGSQVQTGGNADTQGQDNAKPIQSPDLEKATAAALAKTGQGKVTQTAVGEDGSAFQVEVTLDNGSQVDVQLDQNFQVISSKAEDTGSQNESGSEKAGDSANDKDNVQVQN